LRVLSRDATSNPSDELATSAISRGCPERTAGVMSTSIQVELEVFPMVAILTPSTAGRLFHVSVDSLQPAEVSVHTSAELEEPPVT